MNTYPSLSSIRRLTADGLELVLDYCETDLKKVCFVAYAEMVAKMRSTR
jgi:hypothetical protein